MLCRSAGWCLVVSARSTPDVSPEHVAENRRYWDAMAGEWVAHGEQAWQPSTEPRWGAWHVPETELGLLPPDMSGMRAIELGCGTGYVSAWMARRGASVVAIDNSARQLETARRLAAEHGITSISWVHANAETVDEPAASFDFAISEYGLAIWGDPHAWVPEVHRLLRPGGELVMLGNHPFSMVCQPLDGSSPIGRTLTRPYFGMHRFDWTAVEIDPGGIEFNLPISGWIDLFIATGFEIVAYHELQAPDDATGVAFMVAADWAKEYPAEQVWHVRKLLP